MVIRLTCDCAVADDAVMPIRTEKQCKEEGPLLCFLSVVIRLKVPIEMHYTVIPSKFIPPHLL